MSVGPEVAFDVNNDPSSPMRASSGSQIARVALADKYKSQSRKEEDHLLKRSHVRKIFHFTWGEICLLIDLGMFHSSMHGPGMRLYIHGKNLSIWDCYLGRSALQRPKSRLERWLPHVF